MSWKGESSRTHFRKSDAVYLVALYPPRAKRASAGHERLQGSVIARHMESLARRVACKADECAGPVAEFPGLPISAIADHACVSAKLFRGREDCGGNLSGSRKDRWSSSGGVLGLKRRAQDDGQRECGCTERVTHSQLRDGTEDQDHGGLTKVRWRPNSPRACRVATIDRNWDITYDIS